MLLEACFCGSGEQRRLWRRLASSTPLCAAVIPIHRLTQSSLTTGVLNVASTGAQVRPGGMERPQDDYKLTHNVTLSPRDTRFGGQVSRLQVAELVGAAVANTQLAENKVSACVMPRARSVMTPLSSGCLLRKH